MGFLPVSRCLHVCAAALQEQEVKLLVHYRFIEIESVTLLMALLNGVFKDCVHMRKYFGFI